MALTDSIDSTADGPVTGFSAFGVHPDLVRGLQQVGIIEPFPIQAMTLPVALEGHDIIGQAKTGTGKTLGFGLPLLHRTEAPGSADFDSLPQPGAPQALVVVPTRELAVQVAADLTTASSLRATRVLTVYGGRAYEPQVESLRRGVEVVVGTPGRLLDLAQQGHLRLGHVRTLVLDEADEMLDLGFLPDVERLLALTPSDRQMMLFSATMPGAVVSLARRFMTQPTHIRAVDPTDEGVTLKAISQYVYRAHALDKAELLARLLQATDRGLTMVFARTKRTVAKITDELGERGFAVAAIHGDLGQGAREQSLRAFRAGKVDVLVATDVAARGIDVDGITHVVNYQCPEDDKTYLHRIGRTGRAGRTGTAVTFVDWDDVPRWTLINKALDLGIPEPAETYSSSSHVYLDLGIPPGTTGTLPRARQVRAGLDAEEVEDLGDTRHRRGGHATASRDQASGRTTNRGRRRSAGPGSGATDPDARRREQAGPDQAEVDGSTSRRQRTRRRTRGAGAAIRSAEPPAASRDSADDLPHAQPGSPPSTESGADSAGRIRRRRRGGRGPRRAAGQGTSVTAAGDNRADGPPPPAAGGLAEGSGRLVGAVVPEPVGDRPTAG
ncbi:MAG: DEAD/DEAH box helicase [Angustibacter sp.]